MNKRKIMLLASALMMVAVLAVGGTLAYFVDSETATNVFTVGNVDITLKETYEQNSILRPTTGKDADGNVINAVEKDVWVGNDGTEDAYVRLHIAIPAELDDGDPKFDASSNLVHFNAATETFQDGKWNWGKAPADNDNLPAGTMVNDNNWNFYTFVETVNAGTENELNIKYNVYVVTYETALKTLDETEQAIYQIYLEKTATNEDIAKAKAALGANWEIKVFAQGVQATGFDTAFDAFNAAYSENQLYKNVFTNSNN